MSGEEAGSDSERGADARGDSVVFRNPNTPPECGEEEEAQG